MLKPRRPIASPQFIFLRIGAPPCQRFTPVLVDTCNDAKKKGLEFEVVFVSSDHSEKEMLEYMTETDMPWLALPYNSAAAEETKAFKHDVLGSSSIPFLIILNGQGEIISTRGRDLVEAEGVNAMKKWLSQKPAVFEDGGLPSPEKEDLTFTELTDRLYELDGRVVETTITSASKFERIAPEKFCATCYYYDGIPAPSNHSLSVLIPKEGENTFRELDKELSFNTSKETVYFLIRNRNPTVINDVPYKLEAVGTRYRKSSNEYRW